MQNIIRDIKWFIISELKNRSLKMEELPSQMGAGLIFTKKGWCGGKGVDLGGNIPNSD